MDHLSDEEIEMMIQWDLDFFSTPNMPLTSVTSASTSGPSVYSVSTEVLDYVKKHINMDFVNEQYNTQYLSLRAALVTSTSIKYQNQNIMQWYRSNHHIINPQLTRVGIPIVDDNFRQTYTSFDETAKNFLRKLRKQEVSQWHLQQK